MSKKTDALLEELIKINEEYGDDIELCHELADEALIRFINDPRINAAFHEVEKWCA